MKTNISLINHARIAGMGALGLMTSACAVNGLNHPLPRVYNTTTTDTVLCMDTKTKGFDPGFILSFILPIPDFQKTNSTFFNEKCWSAQIVNMLLDSPVKWHQAVGMVMYDEKFNAVQKVQVDAELKRQGRDINQIRDSLPQKTRTVENERGLTIYYKMPGSDLEAFHYEPFPSKTPPPPVANANRQPS